MMAAHITYVHQHKTHPANSNNRDIFSFEFLRSYVSFAKRFNPTIATHLHQYIINKYIDKRKEMNDTTKATYTYTTPRTLLGVIRLSQALAKIRYIFFGFLDKGESNQDVSPFFFNISMVFLILGNRVIQDVLRQIYEYFCCLSFLGRKL